ncbi:MAG TPA: DeoR/GlpR family DNA-binding transcription regulator [Solirubrobacteraceae bacterium]|jgi:DeoR/GlpR family transcriptional regulator of sugar metabolism|nr:DeoR/GlpR family DNA-binding transcription regulator [Solirubrobacteraceae bacterium]
MLTAERRQAILGRLERDGKVVASELVAALGVSEDTVRRDLRELAAGGLVQRVHGGALPPASAASFDQRLHMAPEAKAHLAEAALPLLEGASVIVLDGGTTALELARRLPADRDCTVLTNAPPVAVALAGHPRAEVVLIGGRLLKDSQVTVGAATVDALRQVRADACVLGVCSLHPEFGVTVIHHDEAHVKRAMVAASGEVIALATADKLGTASPWLVAPLAAVTHLVTDAEDTAEYAATGLNVVHA